MCIYRQKLQLSFRGQIVLLVITSIWRKTIWKFVKVISISKKDNTSHSRSGYSRSHEIHIKVNNMMHCYCGKKWQLHSFNKYNIMTTWILYVLLSFHFLKHKYCFYFSCYGSWDNSYSFKARNISLTSFIWDVLRTMLEPSKILKI